MNHDQFSEELLDSETRGGEIRRKILEIVANNPEIIIKEVINSLGESEIPAAPGETATRHHIDRLEEADLIEKNVDAQSRPLTLMDKGEKVCKQAGIKLSPDPKESFIESLNVFFELGNLDSQEKERIEEILSDEVLETLTKISRIYPLPPTEGTLDNTIQNAEVGSSVYEILKPAWIFDDQRYEADSSNLMQTGDRDDQLLAKIRGKGLDSLVIALKSECFSKLEEFCDLLGELEQQSQRLTVTRESVKSAYRDRKLEGFFPEGIKVPPLVKFEIQKAHSKKVKRELLNMKKWIKETDVRIVPKKSMSGHKYKSKNGRIFSNLNEHLPELVERFQKFEKKLNWQGPPVRSFSQLFKDQDVSAIKSCYSSVDWRKSKSKLVKCLEEKGIDLSEDRHLWRDSEGQLVPSTSKKSVNDRLEYLGRLVEVTLELEKEKIRIAGKLEDNIPKTLIPGLCSIVEEQLKNYET